MKTTFECDVTLQNHLTYISFNKHTGMHAQVICLRNIFCFAVHPYNDTFLLSQPLYTNSYLKIMTHFDNLHWLHWFWCNAEYKHANLYKVVLMHLNLYKHSHIIMHCFFLLPPAFFVFLSRPIMFQNRQEKDVLQSTEQISRW